MSSFAIGVLMIVTVSLISMSSTVQANIELVRCYEIFSHAGGDL